MELQVVFSRETFFFKAYIFLYVQKIIWTRVCVYVYVKYKRVYTRLWCEVSFEL